MPPHPSLSPQSPPVGGYVFTARTKNWPGARDLSRGTPALQILNHILPHWGRGKECSKVYGGAASGIVFVVLLLLEPRPLPTDGAQRHAGISGRRNESRRMKCNPPGIRGENSQWIQSDMDPDRRGAIRKQRHTA